MHGRGRPPVSLRFGQHSERRAFVAVLVGCSAMALFGLAGHGVSVLYLAIAGVSAGAWLVLGARRRRMQLARQRWLRAGLAGPREPNSNVRRIEF